MAINLRRSFRFRPANRRFCRGSSCGRMTLSRSSRWKLQNLLGKCLHARLPNGKIILSCDDYAFNVTISSDGYYSASLAGKLVAPRLYRWTTNLARNGMKNETAQGTPSTRDWSISAYGKGELGGPVITRKRENYSWSLCRCTRIWKRFVSSVRFGKQRYHLPPSTYRRYQDHLESALSR